MVGVNLIRGFQNWNRGAVGAFIIRLRFPLQCFPQREPRNFKGTCFEPLRLALASKTLYTIPHPFAFGRTVVYLMTLMWSEKKFEV